jgi:hypothetical protein
VGADPDDQFVAESRSPRDDIEMAIGERVERPGVKGDALHGVRVVGPQASAQDNLRPFRLACDELASPLASFPRTGESRGSGATIQCKDTPA